MLIAPEAAESLGLDAAEPIADDALASGVVAEGMVVGLVVVAAGVVVVDVSSFLLQPASAARLNDKAAMKVSDRM